MSINDEFKIELLRIASITAQRGYTIENQGKFDLIKNQEKTSICPENIVAIYNELLERFKLS